MTVEELTIKIRTDYPEVAGKLIYFLMDNSEYRLRGVKISDDNYEEIKFKYLYAELEDFFEENGIRIEFSILECFEKSTCGCCEGYFLGYLSDVSYSIYYVKSDNYFHLVYESEYMKKIEAKQEAILKACKIMNNQIKGII